MVACGGLAVEVPAVRKSDVLVVDRVSEEKSGVFRSEIGIDFRIDDGLQGGRGAVGQTDASREITGDTTIILKGTRQGDAVWLLTADVAQAFQGELVDGLAHGEAGIDDLPEGSVRDFFGRIFLRRCRKSDVDPMSLRFTRRWLKQRRLRSLPCLKVGHLREDDGLTGGIPRAADLEETATDAEVTPQFLDVPLGPVEVLRKLDEW